MSNINEDLLAGWLKLSTSVVNSRVVNELSVTESLVCNILYKNYLDNPGHELTATDLCNETKMLKSQMNRTLNELEKKGIVIRERSKVDKRQIYVKMDMENADLYHKQHERIIKIVDKVIEKLGEEKSVEAVNLIREVTNIADELLQL